MKTTFLIALVLSFGLQPAFPPALQSLIDAEKNFAQTSVDNNIKSAFLSSLDDNGIVFKNGEPVNGLKNWEAEAENDGYLFWWPVYADIASSQDLGYTTGPAIFGGTRTKPEPVGGMYYSSVWRKNKDGIWKVAVDLGSATFTVDSKKEEAKTSSSPLSSKQKKSNKKDESELFTVDKNYVAALNKDHRSFLPSYFSAEARLHRPRTEPITNIEAIQNYKEENKFELEHVSGGTSESADMGYTYGKVKVERIKDGQTQIIAVNYMRVWKKEKNDWKIVLDVIGG